MADVKLTALTELTDPSSDDMLYVVDSPGGSPSSKKASVANVVDARYQGIRLVDPTALSWSWVNQGTSTVTETNQRCCITPQAGAGSHSHRLRVKTAPTPPYTITALVKFLGYNQNYNSVGLAFRQSSDGKLHTFANYFYNNVWYIYSRKFSSPTAWSADYTSQIGIWSNPMWLRIADNNTNRICSISADGITWLSFHSVGRTDYLTADQVGFYCDPYAANQGSLISILSWSEG